MARLTPEERAAQNRANAARSTGPRSEEGKRRASQNSRKSGLRARAASLPPEEAAELREIHDEWDGYYKPKSPLRRAMLERATYAQLQFYRAVEAHAAHVAECVAGADEAYLAEQQAHVDENAARLADEPADAVSALKQTAAGCRFLIRKWDELRGLVEEYGCLYGASHRDLLLHLMGLVPDDIRTNEDVFWWSMVNIRAMRHPGESSLAFLDDPANIPSGLFYLRLEGYPSHDDCVRSLRELVEGELAVLVDREAHLRETIEEPGRAGAPALAKVPTDEKGALLLRYARMNDTEFHRACKALLKGEDGPVGGSEGNGSPDVVADRDAAPNEADSVVTSGETPVNEPEAPIVVAETRAPNEADSGTKAASPGAADDIDLATPDEAGEVAAPNEADSVEASNESSCPAEGAPAPMKREACDPVPDRQERIHEDEDAERPGRADEPTAPNEALRLVAFS